MKVKYVGPHPEVLIENDQEIPRGKAVDVPDELAEQLLEQDTWRAVGGAAAPATPKQTGAK